MYGVVVAIRTATGKRGFSGKRRLPPTVLSNFKRASSCLSLCIASHIHIQTFIGANSPFLASIRQTDIVLDASSRMIDSAKAHLIHQDCRCADPPLPAAALRWAPQGSCDSPGPCLLLLRLRSHSAVLIIRLAIVVFRSTPSVATILI